MHADPLFIGHAGNRQSAPCHTPVHMVRPGSIQEGNMLVAQRLTVRQVDCPSIQRSQVDHIPPGLAGPGWTADQFKTVLEQASNRVLLRNECFHSKAATITKTNDPPGTRIPPGLAGNTTEGNRLYPGKRHPDIVRPPSDTNLYHGKIFFAGGDPHHATTKNISSLEEKEILLAGMILDPVEHLILSCHRCRDLEYHSPQAGNRDRPRLPGP